MSFTNIGEAHIELLGSVDKIASAKGEILDHLTEDGVAVLPADGAFIRREAGRCRGKVIYFGIEQDCDISAVDLRADGGGNCFTVKAEGFEEEFFLPMPGKHNVLNALAAIAVSREIGFSAEEIKQGLSKTVITPMRLEILEAGQITVVNDTYNANPDSAKAALQVMREISAGRRMVAVLGDMLELGDRGLDGHREVGAEAAGIGVERLVTVGGMAVNIAAGALDSGMRGSRVYTCSGKTEAAELLSTILKPGDIVLVKGSRSMGMEQLVTELLAARARV